MTVWNTSLKNNSRNMVVSRLQNCSAGIARGSQIWWTRRPGGPSCPSSVHVKLSPEVRYSHYARTKLRRLWPLRPPLRTVPVLAPTKAHTALTKTGVSQRAWTCSSHLWSGQTKLPTSHLFTWKWFCHGSSLFSHVCSFPVHLGHPPFPIFSPSFKHSTKIFWHFHNSFETSHNNFYTVQKSSSPLHPIIIMYPCGQ